MSYREDADAYLEALYLVDRKDRQDEEHAKEQRLKELMTDLLATIKEYSEKHEKPDEILFVLDNIANAYRTAFESTGGN